jgi:hypothetical protein
VVQNPPDPPSVKYTWTPIQLPPEFANNRNPELRRDNQGQVWLAAPRRTGNETANNSQLDLCRIIGNECHSATLNGFQPFVTWPRVKLDKATLRTGQGVDFAVYFPDKGTKQIRFVVHEITDDPVGVGVRVVHCTAPAKFASSFTCQTVPGWGTSGIPGQAFQPTIALVDKDPNAPTGLQWSYVVLNDGLSVQPNDDVQRLRAVQVMMFGGPGNASRLVRRSPDTAARVCTAQYPVAPYWGDYFGYVGFERIVDEVGEWVHLGAFSHDNGQGCDPFNNFQGTHLHVASSIWVDP